MAWLSTGEVNTRQIVAFVEGLDVNYEEEGRIATWSIYQIIELPGGDESYVLIKTATTDIAPKAYTTAYIFSNLTPATHYRITVTISNINGSPDKYFQVQQSTATSGGSDYGNIPHIRFFNLESVGIGVPQIKCYLRITNLVAGSNSISIAVYEKNTGLLATSWSTVSDNKRFDEYIELPANDYDNLKFTTYRVRLLVNSEGAEQQEAEAEISLTETVISLYCFFEDKTVTLGENNNVTAVVQNYPNISAESWNAFWDIVNAVRLQAGLDEITDDFVKAVSGNEMSGIIFSYLYDAINDIYGQIGAIFKPTAFEAIKINQYFQITPSVIYGIEDGLRTAYNYFYHESRGTLEAMML